jgi:hypothetical protein
MIDDAPDMIRRLKSLLNKVRLAGAMKEHPILGGGLRVSTRLGQAGPELQILEGQVRNSPTTVKRTNGGQRK